MRVVTPGDLAQHEHNQALQNAAQPDEQTLDELAAHIRTQWEIMRNHRNSAVGWNDRLLHAQRVFNGKYSPEQLAAIKQFGGSEVFARTIALKCRGASALLREVYLGTDRPWGLDPTPDPDLPDDIMGSVQALVNMEAQSAMSDGQQLDINQLRDRTNQLIAAAKMATKKKAKEEADKAEDRLDDILREGGFYGALTEFITDLPLFPFACIKGPVVRIVPSLKWVQGKAVSENTPKMFWERKSPFDIYWTPGVSDIRDASFIERQRLTRSHLNEVMDLPGYNKDNILKVLDEYGRGGLADWNDSIDQERSEGESRESPVMNRSEMIGCVEFHGNVQGRMLLQYGFTPEEVPDDYVTILFKRGLLGDISSKCKYHRTRASAIRTISQASRKYPALRLETHCLTSSRISVTFATPPSVRLSTTFPSLRGRKSWWTRNACRRSKTGTNSTRGSAGAPSPTP
jgi:hypothetical protein